MKQNSQNKPIKELQAAGISIFRSRSLPGSRRPVQCAGRSGSLTVLVTLVICFLGSLGALAQQNNTAAHAPLDTLRDNPDSHIIAQQEKEFSQPNIEISRKRLPKVSATTVPLTQIPGAPPRLDDPLGGQWHLLEARKANVADNIKDATTHLAAALNSAPENPEILRWQSLQALKSGDTATLRQALPDYVHAVRKDPLTQLRLLVVAHQYTLLLVGIFWTLLVVGLTLAKWQNLAHDLTALLSKNRRHSIHLALPILLPITFIILRPGWFGYLAAMSVPLFVQSRGKTRLLLATTWVLVIALVTPIWAPIHNAVPALDPKSETVLLDQACVLPASGYITSELNKRLSKATNPKRVVRLQTALAIQQARRGKFSHSNKLFRQVVAAEPQNYPAMVGLGNNLYYTGQLDRAATQYKNSIAYHSDRGEIHYNLAQVYFKKLFIPEAADAMDTSRNLGFNPLAHKPTNETSEEFAPVIYPQLTNESLLAACAAEAKSYPAMVTISSWENVLGSPPFPLYLLIGAPLLFAMALTLLWSNQHDPRACENCGVPVCRVCCRVRDDAWLCPTCGETATRSRSATVLATLLRNSSRSQGLASTHRTLRLDKFFPGSGYLHIDKPGKAVVRLSVMSLGVFLVMASWIFDASARWMTPGMLLDSEILDTIWCPLPVSLWPGFDSPQVVVGLVILVLTWVVAALLSNRLRNAIPERFSLAPVLNDEEKESVPGPGNAPETGAMGGHGYTPGARIGAGNR